MRSSSDRAVNDSPPSLKHRILKETAIIGGLVFVGLAVLPVLVYFVGEAVFGEYGGSGLPGFYVRLHEDLRIGEPAAVFLLFSPVILWLLLRLTLRLFRRLGRQPA